MTDLVLLDTSGDAVLAGPEFQEGHKIHCGERIQVELGDDNSLAMEVILKALHYRKPNQCAVDAERLASIAVHCDKYDCTGALSSWISYWFSNLTPITRRPEDLGFLLLAAYNFNYAEQFKEISASALEI